MKRKTHINRLMLGALLACCSYTASAAIAVDESQGQLTVTSDINGLVIVKVIGPDDVVVVDDQYQGNSFSWSPSSGPDGAYRYDVRIVNDSNSDSKDSNFLSDYAGGSVEVINGVIATFEDEEKEQLQ